jgi:hypothetical protein
MNNRLFFWSLTIFIAVFFLGGLYYSQMTNPPGVMTQQGISYSSLDQDRGSLPPGGSLSGQKGTPQSNFCPSPPTHQGTMETPKHSSLMDRMMG